MYDLEDGFKFWKRVDIIKGLTVSLKEVISQAGLNYELVKVQRSLNRLPKATDVCRIALALHIPSEWLITGEADDPLDTLRIANTDESQRILKLMRKLAISDSRVWTAVEVVLDTYLEEPIVPAYSQTIANQ
jgi:hypothetical protein